MIITPVIGRRVYPKEDGWLPNLEPGDYGHIGEGVAKTHPGAAGWMGVTPDGHHCNLRGHKVVEHEDGTITVSPSILISIPARADLGRPKQELWHGFLERGVWRAV
jgi:hypothetical protein